jgi:hypothetical protein
LTQGLERTAGFRAEFLREFAARSGLRIFLIVQFALRDGPCAEIAAAPERPARMDQKNVDAAALAAVHQNAGTIPSHHRAQSSRHYSAAAMAVAADPPRTAASASSTRSSQMNSSLSRAPAGIRDVAEVAAVSRRQHHTGQARRRGGGDPHDRPCYRPGDRLAQRGLTDSRRADECREGQMASLKYPRRGA